MASTTKVNELEERVKTEGLLPLIEKHRGRESNGALLGRFLVARSENVDKALDFLKEDLEWRESVNPSQYWNVTSSQLLLVNGSLAGKAMLDQMLPVMYLGRDRQGRPATYRKFASCLDAVKLTSETGLDKDKYIEFNIWCLERLCKTMDDDGQWVSITDLSEFAFRHVTKMHLGWAKVMADLMKDHYPERLGKSLMINAPSVFSMAWSIAKTWLDDRIRQKIGIYAGEKQWKPEMEKLFDLDILPESLGGKTKIATDPHTLDPQPQPSLPAGAATN